MSEPTGDQRAKDDRQIEPGRRAIGYGYVDLSHYGTKIKPLGFGELGPTRMVLDEVPITPSRKYQQQDAIREAKKVIRQSEKGKRVSDQAAERIQQRLLSTARRDQLVGRESDSQQLAQSLGEVRRSQRLTEAREVLENTGTQGKVTDKYLEQLQRRLLGIERQDQLYGRPPVEGEPGEAFQLARSLREVRRGKLLTEADDVLKRVEQGRKYGDKYLESLAQKLMGMERQDELSDIPGQGRILADALADVRRSNLLAEVNTVVAKAKQGQHYPKPYVKKLLGRLLGMQKQEQLLGDQNTLELALELAEIGRKKTGQ